MAFIILYLIIVNFMGYIIMYFDKQRAINKKQRVKEADLWKVAIVGGAVGSTLGMFRFRHKTKKPVFRFGFPLLVIIEALLISYLFYKQI